MQRRVYVKSLRFRRRAGAMAVVALAVTLAALTASGVGSAAGSKHAAGTVNLGLSTTLTGSIAALGQGSSQGAQLAVADLNRKGGLLGKKINLIVKDDAATPATGSDNVKALILNDHVAALLGPVSSGVAGAELPLADQYKVPIFLDVANSVTLLTKTWTPYAFQLVPNTVMEPRAVAAYLKKYLGTKAVSIATFAPDYVFGHSTVDGFLQALKDLDVKFGLIDQEWPALGAADIGPQLSALISKKPQVTFNVQFGNDIVNFTNQASGYGFFKNTRLIAMYSYDPLKALAGRAPAGAVAFDRAPYWAIKTPEMASFVQRYHAKFKDYPDEWAILTYTAVETWAYGVAKAKSFDGGKVGAAVAGSAIPTIRGKVPIRACDHQAAVPEYVATVNSRKDKTTGFPLWTRPIYVAPPSKIMLTCQQSLALRP
jgi:branched-chain amino acid transport system substrate-binding protein